LTRLARTAVGLCVFGLLWVGPLTLDAARAAPALKDHKGLTKQAREDLQARTAALGKQLSGGFERVKIGKDSLVDFLQVLRDWYEAEVALAETREAERLVLENALRRLTVVEEQMAQLHQAGIQPYDSVVQCRAAREKAQLELEKRLDGK
jgi:hypothetical protein